MPLFKTIDEIRLYVAINANTYFDTIKPSILEAEELYIKTLLGDFYSVLLADYTDHTDAEGTNVNMNPDNLALMPYVQRSLAHYAIHLSVDSLGVTIGDAGIQQSSGPNSQPAQRWQVLALQTSLITKADRFADKLLEYLEENAAADKYGAWFGDMDANTAMSGLIVYSTKIAGRYIDINDSRRIFLRMKKRIEQIEALHIKKMICGDQYDELVTQLQTGSVTAANEALILKIAPLVTRKAFLQTIPSLRIKVTEDGIQLRSTSDGAISNSPVADNTLIGNTPYKNLITSLEKALASDEEDLKKFITDNIADYPLIADSPCYSTEPIYRKYVADNDPCNKHFSV